MNKEKALVNAKYLLQQFPGKGGWTYATIPEIPPGKRIPFGWVRVKGSIDELNNIQKGYVLKKINSIEFNSLSYCDLLKFDWDLEENRETVEYVFENNEKEIILTVNL